MGTATDMRTPVGTPAPIDVLAPGFRVVSPEVRAASERHWYARTELGPAILHYADCVAISRDRRFVQAAAGHLAEQGVPAAR